MTRDEIKQAITTRSDEWLESRWSVLDEAIKAIEPHLAEVEAAFDHDYTLAPDTPESLEQTVCDQVLRLCNVVTTHDSEVTMSWGELLELIDIEIKRREMAIMECPDCHFSNVSEYSCSTCNSTGKVPRSTQCPSCSGRGHLPMQLKRGSDSKPKTCPDCNGIGENAMHLVKAGDILCDSSDREVQVLPANTDSARIECQPIFDCPLCNGHNPLQIRADVKCPQCGGTRITS